MTLFDQPSPIILGLWPIAGITTVGVTRREARETIAKAIDCGITSFDTAFSYGFDGESDRLLGEFVGRDRERFRVIGKVGQRWDENRNRIVDGSPATLLRDTETSLKRTGIDSFDVLLLHSPDPNVPLDQSARTMAEMQQRGLCRSVGISNVTVEQYLAYAETLRTLDSRCDVIQCPLNLLQRDSLRELIPVCADNRSSVYVFWTLMKGLLAGKIGRDHVFADGDSRPCYAIFQGKARQRAHDVLDAMTTISQSTGMTLAQLSIGWAISQRGVSGVLVGARRPDQIAEIAKATTLTEEIASQIDQIVAHSFD
jgi:aryl-alcohol dehydrogenase-like predicted oxidoreductase